MIEYEGKERYWMDLFESPIIWKEVWGHMKGGLRSYESNGKNTLYVDGWKNGLRKGYGTESRRVTLVYIGEWKWRIC